MTTISQSLGAFGFIKLGLIICLPGLKSSLKMVITTQFKNFKNISTNINFVKLVIDKKIYLFSISLLFILNQYLKKTILSYFIYLYLLDIFL